MDQFITNLTDSTEEDDDEKGKLTKKKRNRGGLVVAGFVGAVAFGLSALTFPFISPALRKVCLPFVPATETQVRNVMTALNGKNGKVIDLGSGDGRLVLEAAKRGFLVDGVELNPLLVWYSRFSSRSKHLHYKTNFIRKDLFKVDLSDYKHVIIFGVDEMMDAIEMKASKELSLNGGRLIACRFPLPSKRPKTTFGTGIDTIWIYDFEQQEKKKKSI